MKIGIETIGAREFSARVDAFTPKLHEKLEQRIGAALADLWDSVEETVPHLTGRLASEIRSRMFSGARNRVAGYVGVYSPDPGPAPHNEYAKAAALEYGSSKPRAVASESGVMTRLAGSSRRIKARMSAAVDLAPRRYLRGPFEALQPQIKAAIEEAIAETVAESNGGAL